MINIESLPLASSMMAAIDGQRISAEFKVVDPETATEWIDVDLYEGQRTLRRGHVELLSEAMLNGRFRAASKIEFVYFDGNWHLVDGQHTLNSIKRSGVSQTLLVMRRWVESFEALQKIYATFGRELARTPADVMKGLGLDKKFLMNEQQLNAFFAAVKFPLNNYRNLTNLNNPVVKSDVIFVAGEMVDWVTPAQSYFAAIGEAAPMLRKSLMRSPIMSVGLATFKYQPKHAEIFWTNIATGEGQYNGDPTKVAREWLIYLKGQGSIVVRIKTIAHSWNKFCKRQTQAKVSMADKGKGGVTILGTPFKAEERGKADNDE